MTVREKAIYMMQCICCDLDLECPPYKAIEQRNNVPLCFFDKDKYMLVCAFDVPRRRVIYEMAYSLRRIYQIKYDSTIMCGYRQREDLNKDDFFTQAAEIDAHSYAYSVIIRVFDDYLPPVEFPQEALTAIRNRTKCILNMECNVLSPETICKGMNLAADKTNEPLEILKNTWKSDRPNISGRRYDYVDLYEYLLQFADTRQCDIDEIDDYKECMHELIRIVDGAMRVREVIVKADREARSIMRINANGDD